MCFTNVKSKLDKIRKQKRPIPVWKRVEIDRSTGEAYSRYGQHRTVWKQGTVVKPDRKRQPLADGSVCSSGLYFYMGKLPDYYIGRPGYIDATVMPKDVIAAVDDCGDDICVTAATVLNDPNPGWLETKRAQAKKRVERAKEVLKQRAELVKEWYEGGREEWEEAYQLLKDELTATEEEVNAQKPKRKTRSKKAGKKIRELQNMPR